MDHINVFIQQEIPLWLYATLITLQCEYSSVLYRGIASFFYYYLINFSIPTFNCTQVLYFMLKLNIYGSF